MLTQSKTGEKIKQRKISFRHFFLENVVLVNSPKFSQGAE